MSRQGQLRGYQNHACSSYSYADAHVTAVLTIGHKLHYVHAYTYCFIRLLFVSKGLKPC